MRTLVRRALYALPLLATPCLAQSNIGLTQYPAPKCEKPQPVTATQPRPLPEKYTDDQAIAYNKQVDAYNAQMRSYNAQMTAYGGCLNAYIANGNADMQRIRAALDAAVAASKAP
jgi:hypothetical protein